MPVDPAVIGIRYWTGIGADAEVRRKTLEEIFGGGVA